MISLRYHAVSLAAVFLAVALGAVLGSTSQSGGLLSGLGSERAALGKQLADVKAQRNAQDARLLDADRFAATIGPMAVRGLLARHSVVLVTTPNVAQSDRDALLGLLGDAGAMVTGEVQLAVVLTGGQAPSDAAADRSATIARFATQLDRRGFGAVLAGGSGSADGGGPVGVVRADPAADSILSTVDDVDGGAGRVATVLALREQLNGRAGRYGTAGNAQAPAPQPAM